MAGKPTGTTLLTAGFYDPLLRAQWEREEQKARELALGKLDEIEKLYREMLDADGLGLDLKHDAEVLDVKRLDIEALKPIVGRHLIRENIALVREALTNAEPWREDFANLRDRHERVIFALGPDLARGVSGIARSRAGGAARKATAEKRWPELRTIVDKLADQNSALGRKPINMRAAKIWNKQYPGDPITYKTVERAIAGLAKKKSAKQK